MNLTLGPGARCRSTRPIVHPRGLVRRATQGTIRAQRENIGRRIFTVEFDSGEKLVLFADEIEPACEPTA